MEPEKLKALLKDPEKIKEHLEKLFALLDKDKKGYLVPDQIKAGAKQRLEGGGIPIIPEDPERQAEFLKVADPNNTGKVTLDGFKAAAKHLREKAIEVVKDPAKLQAEVKRVFARLDIKKQGYLDMAVLDDIDAKILELHLPVPKLPNDLKDKLKKLADPNGTGKVTEEGLLGLVKAVVEKMKADGFFQ